MQNYFETPLVSPESILDDYSKELIKKIYDAEYQKSLTLPSNDPLDQKRMIRVDYTWTELNEQPEIIQKNLKIEKENIVSAAQKIHEKNIDHIYMTGCGDSIASMIAVRSFYENLLGIPCEPIQALDFTYYYNKPVNERSLVVTLSSSGATVRTVEAMLVARALGAETLTLSNTAGSPLVNESTHSIMIHAQRKGWPTQSSTAAMALLYKLGIEIARCKGISSSVLENYENLLTRVPEQIQQVIDEQNQPMIEVSEAEYERKIYLFAGGGPAYASTFIGAAKIKECTPDHAIAIPLEEYHHYSSQKEGDPLLLTAPKGLSVPRALDTAKEGRRHGGKVYSIVTDGDHTLDEYSNRVFYLPAIDEFLSPLVYTIPLQLFAYHSAKAKYSHAIKGAAKA